MESSHVKELYNKELKSSLKGLLGSFVPLSVETNDKEFPSSGQSLRLGVNTHNAIQIWGSFLGV